MKNILLTEVPVFVINLARSVARRRTVLQRLAAIALTAEIFAAVDGELLDRARGPDLARATHLSDGEVGAYLSHKAVWCLIAERGLAGALILEDDVQLSADLPAVLAALQSGAAHGVDFVRLANSKPALGIALQPLPAGRVLMLPTKNPSGALAYWVTARGARRLISAFGQPRVPVDTALDRAWAHGLHALMTVPALVQHDDNAESTIEATGRMRLTTALPLPARVHRSLSKHLALAKTFQHVTGRNWFAYWLARAMHER